MNRKVAMLFLSLFFFFFSFLSFLFRMSSLFKQNRMSAAIEIWEKSRQKKTDRLDFQKGQGLFTALGIIKIKSDRFCRVCMLLFALIQVIK